MGPQASRRGQRLEGAQRRIGKSVQPEALQAESNPNRCGGGQPRHQEQGSRSQKTW